MVFDDGFECVVYESSVAYLRKQRILNDLQKQFRSSNYKCNSDIPLNGSICMNHQTFEHIPIMISNDEFECVVYGRRQRNFYRLPLRHFNTK